MLSRTCVVLFDEEEVRTMRTTRQKHKSKAKEQEKRGARHAVKKAVRGVKVEIAFDNEEAAHHFLSWLCGSGEQHYWDWMECREWDEEGPITAVDFDYYGLNGDSFGPKVKTTCGRLKRL